jgi:uncharacterized tellurite resistance protein B-like protein
LAEHGVDTIFGYPGGAVLPLYDAIFQQDQIQHVLVRHEQAAAHAADVAQRLCRVPHRRSNAQRPAAALRALPNHRIVANHPATWGEQPVKLRNLVHPYHRGWGCGIGVGMIDAISDALAWLFGSIGQIFGHKTARQHTQGDGDWVQVGPFLRRRKAAGLYDPQENELVDNQTVMIAIAVFAAELCLSDGHADEEERAAFANIFSFPGYDQQAVQELLNEAERVAPAGADAVATRFFGERLGEIRSLHKNARIKVIIGLCHVAQVGGISGGEREYLCKVAEAIGFSRGEFEDLFKQYQEHLVPPASLEAAHEHGEHLGHVEASLTAAEKSVSAEIAYARKEQLHSQLEAMRQLNTKESTKVGQGSGNNSQMDAAFATQRAKQQGDGKLR